MKYPFWLIIVMIFSTLNSLIAILNSDWFAFFGWVSSLGLAICFYILIKNDMIIK